MHEARVFLDPHFTVGEVNPRLFGSFLEHLGRAVYTGVFEPDHPSADADGLRTDVLALVRELGTTMVRYPGGNFVSGYRWEDGTGPADPDRHAKNTLAEPARVVPRTVTGATIEDGQLRVELPPLSWNTISFS